MIIIGDNTETNWFWELATKWWFFPSLYFILSILYYLIAKLFISNFGEGNLMIIAVYNIIIFPVGLITFGSFLLGYNSEPLLIALRGYYIWIYYILTISLVIIITHYKNKRNKTIKWLIIILLMLLVFTFIGRIINTLVTGDFFGFL